MVAERQLVPSGSTALVRGTNVPALHRDLDRLGSDDFDVAVVGGGISGVAIAYEAAARGLKTALLERGDYAAGTTTAATKLIHGGVRYLETYEFGLVREALRERRVLLNVAPHLVNSVPFLVPVYRGHSPGRLKLGAAMVLYDLLSYDKNWRMRTDKHMPWRRNLSASEVMALEPAFQPTNLKGAALYYDGQVPSPARLTIEFAKSAVRHGAAVSNYASVQGLVVENGAVKALEVRDVRGGRDLQVKAKVVVNAAGLWATQIMGMLKSPPPVHLAPSKGIHLITRPLLREHAAVFVTKAGRKLMIIPWLGRSLIGTTDAFYSGDIERIRCTQDEVVKMVAEVNEVLPSAKLQVEEIQRTYAGCRPLIGKEGVSSLDLSRHWEILDHAKEGAAGVYSVVGGKLTTSRSVAEHVITRVEKHLGRRSPSPTTQLPVGGGDLGPLAEAIGEVERQHGLPKEVASSLIHSYGSAVGQVLDGSDARGKERLRSDLPILRAEVRHAVQWESAFTVTDVALRRTDLGNLGDRSGEGGRAVGEEMQKLLGWSDGERDAQVNRYLDEQVVDAT